MPLNGPGRVERAGRSPALVDGGARPRRLGHVVLATPDLEASHAFFVRGAGLQGERRDRRSRLVPALLDRPPQPAHPARAGHVPAPHGVGGRRRRRDRARRARAARPATPRATPGASAAITSARTSSGTSAIRRGTSRSTTATSTSSPRMPHWTPQTWEGRTGLYAWGPPPPTSFLVPDDLAELIAAGAMSRRRRRRRHRRRARGMRGGHPARRGGPRRAAARAHGAQRRARRSRPASCWRRWRRRSWRPSASTLPAVGSFDRFTGRAERVSGPVVDVHRFRPGVAWFNVDKGGLGAALRSSRGGGRRPPRTRRPGDRPRARRLGGRRRDGGRRSVHRSARRRRGRPLRAEPASPRAQARGPGVPSDRRRALLLVFAGAVPRHLGPPPLRATMAR